MIKLSHTERILFERFSIHIITATTNSKRAYYCLARWLKVSTETYNSAFDSGTNLNLNDLGYIIESGWGDAAPDELVERYSSIINGNHDKLLDDGIPDEIYKSFKKWLDHETNQAYLKGENRTWR